MATIKEGGFQEGDIVVAVSAFKNNGKDILGSTPLDTPGAKVEFGIYKVLQLDVPLGRGLGTELESLMDQEICLSSIKRGETTAIFNGFHNFILEGDYRIQEELAGAGFRVQGYVERDGSVMYEVVRSNPDTTPENHSF